MANPLTAFQIYVGARNDAPNRTNTPAQVQRLHAVLRSRNYGFTGYTITEGDGYWTPDGGTTAFWEKTFVITLFIDEKTQGQKFEGFTKELMQTLDQAALGVVKVGTAALWYPDKAGKPKPYDPFKL